MFTSQSFSSVQPLSRVWLFATPWTAACQASLSIPTSWSLPKLMFIESVMPSNHLILCHSLLLLPSIFPNISVFSNESDTTEWLNWTEGLGCEHLSFWKNKYLFIYLCWVLVTTLKIFSLCCGMWTLSWDLWGLFPWSGIKPRYLGSTEP